MKRLTIILTFILFFLNYADAASIKTVTKDYKIVTKDGFSMTAKLEYPKIKEKKEFSTVVLLHALGYSSQWWGSLPDEILDNGNAVLLIDLRGHGNSIYNSKLSKTSWKSLTNKAYAKYPDDVITVVDYIKNENKRIFFNNWAIVGADIGCATAIHVANKIQYKPKTLVLISPVIEAKGIYVPIKLAELNKIDILSITGTKDIAGIEANQYLTKFAQSTYAEYTSESTATSILLLKHDRTLAKVIATWISQYLR